METINELFQEISNLEKLSSKNKYDKSNVSAKVRKALLDIENNRNHSWAVEMFERNKNNLDNFALKYRGTKVTYKEMFTKAYDFAKSLKQMGYEKGDKIPMCITNTPEFIYMFLGTSLIGAQANVIGDWFAPDYITEILNKTNSKNVFIDDISYDALKEPIKNSNVKNIVCFSLTNSLKNGDNPYQSVDSLLSHDIKNNVESIRKDYDGKLYNINEFTDLGSKYNGKVVANVDLDDVCSITYTSGTTTPGHPKGVIQSNRSYMTLSRFKESDVSGMPTMKNMSVLAHIPTYTHMELSCAVSDTLYCGCELDLEPFYSKESFPYALLINKPNFVPAGTGFWGHLCKKLEFDPIFQNINMPFLMIPTVTGEGLSEGEEKFYNQTARKHKFGTEKLPFPIAPVCFSIGGGTTESSGIFVTLYKSLQEKKINYLIKKEKLGLTPHKFADIQILNTNGDYCKTNEPGLLVANSPCEMIGYTDENLNKKTHVNDKYGKSWLNLGTYSYKDSTGRVKMKGRMGSFITLSDGSELPYYDIEDTVMKDTKDVMSCTVIKDKNDEIVCHFELQPFKQRSEDECCRGIAERINKNYNDDVKDNLYIRMRDNEESFPLDPSGKRSLSTLKNNGVDDKTLLFRDFQDRYANQETYNDAKVLKKSRN